jgi:hypothetical protein
MRGFKISSHASYIVKYELRCADLGLRSQVQSGDGLLDLVGTSRALEIPLNFRIAKAA